MALALYIVSVVGGVAALVGYQCVALQSYADRRVDFTMRWPDFPRDGWLWRGHKVPLLGMALTLAGLASISWWATLAYVVIMPAAVLGPLALHNLRLRLRHDSSQINA